MKIYNQKVKAKAIKGENIKAAKVEDYDFDALRTVPSSAFDTTKWDAALKLEETNYRAIFTIIALSLSALALALVALFI